jgi:large subunit ribosomal protein L18
MDIRNRQKRHRSIKPKVLGSLERPRVSVYRSARFVYVQIVDDESGKTLAAVHGKTVKGKDKSDQAKLVGESLAKLAQAKGIKRVVFDRSGYRYHGRVKSVVEGLRTGGLEV